MILRYIIGVVMMGFLVGCTATQKPSTIRRLQVEVAYMGSQLDRYDQDIAHLKSTVEALQERLQTPSVTSLPTRKVPKNSEPSSAKTFNSYEHERILRVSATPVEVQQALTNAGYYTGAIDGNVGSGSQKAIHEFQKDHDLESDGIIGKKTWAELSNYLDYTTQ